LYTAYGQTTAQREYLRILLFQVAAMDTLPAIEIELGERLISHFLPKFSLSRTLRPDSVYWVDPQSSQAPMRLARAPETRPELRFFNGATAQIEREALAQRIRSEASVPPEVILGAQYPVENVLRVLDHLGLSWSSKPPVRDHVRRAIEAPLALIHGFQEATQTIAYAQSAARTRIPDLELWSVSDVSRGGMAIVGTLAQGGVNPWPAIGVLVTMKPDGDGNWLVGVVRRVSRNPEHSDDADDSTPPLTPAAQANNPNRIQLGIETLSRFPAAVVGDANRMPIDMILLDLPVVGECCRVLVPPNTVEPTVPVTFALNAQTGRMMPGEILAEGPDYSLVSFFVQSFY
jgi:hypothetical protein